MSRAIIVKPKHVPQKREKQLPKVIEAVRKEIMIKERAALPMVSL